MTLEELEEENLKLRDENEKYKTTIEDTTKALEETKISNEKIKVLNEKLYNRMTEKVDDEDNDDKGSEKDTPALEDLLKEINF